MQAMTHETCTHGTQNNNPQDETECASTTSKSEGRNVYVIERLSQVWLLHRHHPHKTLHPAHHHSMSRSQACLQLFFLRIFHLYDLCDCCKTPENSLVGAKELRRWLLLGGGPPRVPTG